MRSCERFPEIGGRSESRRQWNGSTSSCGEARPLRVGRHYGHGTPMPRSFNTDGPCNAACNYMRRPLRRLPGVHRVIDQVSYFVVHGPRQTGKTSTLLSLAQDLTGEGSHVSALVPMKAGAAFSADVGAAELAVLESWRQSLKSQLPAELQPAPFPEAPPGSRIASALANWAREAPRPVAVFLDDVDELCGEVLVSVLRQVRSGFVSRPRGFPSSLAVVGAQDVRGYRVADLAPEHMNPASWFNITSRSFALGDFTASEVAELYAQHTTDTGQRFAPEAVALAFALTQGQPRRVNALAKVAVEQVVPDASKPIRREDIEQAQTLLGGG